jgi:DNA-directed RNA polymerase specialized sigma24 family protein
VCRGSCSQGKNPKRKHDNNHKGYKEHKDYTDNILDITYKDEYFSNPPKEEAMAIAVEIKTLRRSEAADRLGIHPNTVGSWAERGYLKAVKLPSETRYDAESVEKLREQIYGEE